MMRMKYVRKSFSCILYSWEYGLPLGGTSVTCRCQNEVLMRLYERTYGVMETKNVYVNLEGQSSRDWCLGSEKVVSKYLYIARIKFDLLWRGACLIVLVTLNMWVVLPKDHNADNKHKIRQSLGVLVRFCTRLYSFTVEDFYFKVSRVTKSHYLH